MPELPEVETVRRGVADAAGGCVVSRVIVRRRHLREAVPPDLSRRLAGKTIQSVERRGKYLLLLLPPETCIIHLGMSGVLSLSALPPHEKHAHIGIALDDGRFLIYTDPRRFGLITVTDQPAAAHRLLARMGVEPLSRAFHGRALAALLAGKKTAVKTALMDSRVVAGIGNIYASEALFYSGIHPCTPANRLGDAACGRLARAIKQVLRRAIRAGGSSMRDFAAADGSPGYFQTRWAVYDRAGRDCVNHCGACVQLLRQNGRSSYYCPHCQPDIAYG